MMEHDIIEEQLIRLGLHKITDIEGSLRERFGADKAEKIESAWNDLSDKADRSDEPGRQDDLYAYLNQDYDLSMMVSCYTDADIIRKICGWISEHTRYFGQRILDVGCGTGIVSCMLAMMLPEAYVVAIDRSVECIKIANIVKEKLGVANIKFAHMSVDDMQKPEGDVVSAGRQLSAAAIQSDSEHVSDLTRLTFDTVFSARTFHENIKIRYTDNAFLPFSRQVKTYAQIYAGYCAKLASLVGPGGTLVCIERNHMDTEYYSMLQDLANCGLHIFADSMQELRCEESDFAAKSVFQTFAFKRMSGIESNDIFALWREKAFAGGSEPYMFTRPQVDCYVEQNTDGIISGYETFAENGMQVARTAILKKKGDAENFILHQATLDQAGVQILPLTVLNDVKNAQMERKIIDQAMGYVVKDMA